MHQYKRTYIHQHNNSNNNTSQTKQQQFLYSNISTLSIHSRSPVERIQRQVQCARYTSTYICMHHSHTHTHACIHRRKWVTLWQSASGCGSCICRKCHCQFCFDSIFQWIFKILINMHTNGQNFWNKEGGEQGLWEINAMPIKQKNLKDWFSNWKIFCLEKFKP